MTGSSTNKPQLSIVVPVLNEITGIELFVTHLKSQWSHPQELIFVDGGSTDGTWEWLQKKSFQAVKSTPGRAIQMNIGAARASCDNLYFVHADSRVPKYFDAHLLDAQKRGIKAACFQLQFDAENWLLKTAASGSKWNHLLCRGGDQSLFVDRTLYETLGGFDPRYKVCEDLDFFKKLYNATDFKVLEPIITTSSRRFLENGILRLFFHFRILHFMHWLGVGPHSLTWYYHWTVR